ncbi:MAG: Flp family type IVb pilin [Dermatophilaceae bacterium]
MTARLAAKYYVLKTTREKGATAVEYGVMVAAIIAVIVTVVFAIGTRVLGAFTDVRDALPA